MAKHKPLSQSYTRYATIPLKEGLDILQSAFHEQRKRSVIRGYIVNTSSLRLFTFAGRGTCCTFCGLEATHFALETNNGSPKPHMNMWGVDATGEEILFTHDHIVPKSDGGSDSIHNTQTCCVRCNSKKGSLPDAVYRARRAKGQKRRELEECTG